MPRGSYSLADLAQYEDVSILTFGRDEVLAATQDYIELYNAGVNEQLDLFTFKTKERTMGAGAVAGLMEMTYVDEGGVADTQKGQPAPGVLGFPLRRGQVNRQWTDDYFRRSSPADFALQVQQVTQADAAKLQAALRIAIFKPTNSTFTDRLRANEAIPVKAFANADSFPIPPGLDGSTFTASTHNHYVGSANAFPTEAEIDAVLLNVSEHGFPDQTLWVNQAFGGHLISEAGPGNDYPKFLSLPMPNVQLPVTGTTLTGLGTLDFVNTGNRIIGYYNGRPVRVKPWMPTTAWFVTGTGNGVRKPIAWRIPDDLGGDNGNLRVVFDDYQRPNYIRMMEREFGFAPANRVAAAVMSYGGSDTTYVQPTF